MPSATPTSIAGADNRRKDILFLGDSITAGYGLTHIAEAFPDLIQKKIDADNLPYRTVNGGVNEDTSAGGRERIQGLLRAETCALVVELGANDGLRGLSIDATRANLQAIIDRIHASNPAAKVVLARMRVPANLGSDYTQAYNALFPTLAEKNRVPFISYVLKDIAGQRTIFQPDGIQPTTSGHVIIAETVWKTLRPLL